MASTVNCPYCSKKTDPSLDACPHCGGYIKKKVGMTQSAPQKESKVHCPSCKGPVDDGDIICVACGTNLLTGQKIPSASKLSESADDSDWPMERIFKWLISASVAVLLVLGIYTLINNPVKRAQKLVANGQYPEAQEILTEYVAKSPENAEAHFELGKIQYRANRKSDSATSFQRVLELTPENADAGLYAVLALHNIDSNVSLSQQIDILQTVTQHTPDHAQALYLLGMAYGARGQSGDIEQQIVALEQVTSYAPDMESAQLGLGIAETLQGNYSRAKSHFSGITSPKLQANAQVSQGYIAGYEDDNDNSATLFQQALNSNELNIQTEASLQLAKISLQRGDFVRAQSQLEQVLETDSMNQLARYLLGLTMHSRGKANEALSQFQALVRTNNGFEGPAAVQAANVQLVLNDPDAAQRSISIARKAKEDSPSYHTVQGRIYMTLESVDQAERSFNTAIKMDPSYAPAYLERGLYHIYQNDLESGLEDLNSYLKIVGADMEGTRVREIRMLANQLHTTLKG